MNHIFYTKTDNFKIFGLSIFQKTTVYNETEHDTDYNIIVKQDYYEKEFKTNDKKE